MSNNENQEQPAFVKTPFVPMSKSMNRRPWKIVSGGQTGVDRAALAAAMSFSIATGGWMPCGRLAEDGVVPEPFASLLRECPTGGFRERTRVNVVDSDATLILVDALPLVGGTAYTADYAAKNGRPCKVVLLSDADAVTRIRDWMLSLEDSVRPGQPGGIVLNVAGPRESGSPGIFARAKKTLLEAFAFFRNHSGGDLSAIDEKGRLVAWMDVEFAEELFAEGDIGEDMAVKWKKETHLPMQIWIDESRAYARRGPANRIAFQLDASDELKPDSVGWMDLNGNLSPESPAGKLDESDLAQLRNFVRNNRSALERLADTAIHLDQIWPDIIKGGTPATAEEIKSLADKVAALVESNKNRP